MGARRGTVVAPLSDDELRQVVVSINNNPDKECTKDNHTSAAILERHAADIADAVVELLPSQDAVEKCKEGQMLHTSCDVQIDENGHCEWDGLDTRYITNAVSRILKTRQ